MEDSPRDRELLRIFLKGGETGFDELVLKYRNRVYNTLFSLLRSRDLAWEGAQDVFLKVYRELKDREDESILVKAWVFRITLDEGFDLLKRVSKQVKVAFGTGEMLEAVNGSKELIFWDEGEEWDRDQFSQALGKLSKLQKAIVVLRHFSGLSFGEVAEVLARDEESVKANHYDAVSRLREILKNEST
ncbi:MAG: RNA polymerase sigma factor [Chlamydiae bacterium]|nr:RNA polymerase sigma factor [Chlamydiota bacterium]MBI3265475.1 RNA polymerase sigma factor [Chlamydiota bacterium]